MISVATTGTSPSFPVKCGTYLLDLSGTFNSATITPQQSLNGTNFSTFTKSDGSALSYSGSAVFEVDFADSLLRFVTTGTSTSVFATAKPVTMVGSGQGF